MASFGAKYPNFAPIKEEAKNTLPTYNETKKVTIGGLVKADLTVNLSSGELFADDALKESVSEFASGAIAMETDDMVDEVASVVYGSTVSGKMLVDNTADAAPVGGLAYYKKLMRNKKVFFRGYFYPKVKASLGNDSEATKGSSITFGTTATSFTVYECENGDWRHTEVFETEAEAKTWVDSKLGVTTETYSITEITGKTITGSTATVKTFGVTASKTTGIAVGESITLTAALAENVPAGKKVTVSFTAPMVKQIEIAAGNKQGTVSFIMSGADVTLAATATEAAV